MQGRSYYFLRLGKAGFFMIHNANDLLNVFTQNMHIEWRTPGRKRAPEKRVQNILRCIMQPNPKLNAFTTVETAWHSCVRAHYAHARTTKCFQYWNDWSSCCCRCANLNSTFYLCVCVCVCHSTRRTFHIVYANDYVLTLSVRVCVLFHYYILFRCYEVIKVFVNQYLRIHCD